MRASAVVEEGAVGRGVRWGRKVGDVRDEELNDAIDLEIEKANSAFVKGLLRAPSLSLPTKSVLFIPRGATFPPAETSFDERGVAHSTSSMLARTFFFVQEAACNTSQN